MKVLMFGEFPPMPSGVAYSVYGLSKSLKKHEIHVMEVNISEPRFWKILAKNRLNLSNNNLFVTTKMFSKFVESAKLCLQEGGVPLIFDSLRYTTFLARTYPLIGIYVCGQLTKIISDFKPDIIHAHYQPNAYLASLLCKLLGIPLVTTVHGADMITFGGHSLTQGMVRKTMEESDLVVAVSDELRILAKRYGAKKSVFIPNGVDLEIFEPKTDIQNVTEKFNLKKPIILCPRKLEKKYGSEILVQAAPLILKKYPTATFVFTGFGSLKERIEQLSKKLKCYSSLRLVGWLPHKFMPYIYSASDVVVFPSVAEATSLCALEAMACKKALVTSNVGHFKKLIKQGVNGYVVDLFESSASRYESAFGLPYEKVKELANRIMDIIGDNKMSKEMGENNRELIKRKFSWSVISRKIVNHYNHLRSSNIK